MKSFGKSDSIQLFLAMDRGVWSCLPHQSKLSGVHHRKNGINPSTRDDFLRVLESNQLLLDMDRLGIKGWYPSEIPISCCWSWIGTGSICINCASDSGSSGRIQSASVCWASKEGILRRFQSAVAGHGSARAPYASIVHRIRDLLVESNQHLCAMARRGFPYPSGCRDCRPLVVFGLARHRWALSFGKSNPKSSCWLWFGAGSTCINCASDSESCG
ncbi:hypothetical protein PGTUg99_002058 [Puccinia graminis f. sp. tritici]|uniref:Uncharacterized protein n=1 Tax=Puccinia graminis f. sp. tritici TaxID=56615 RepID=A0A5B0QG16_PUCGR|nr:hypothetical protein PGTUg99_002058 [Puccinia graminis f. sp. tritici]